MEIFIPKITTGFTNINGQTFNYVREIAYKKEELYGNLGKFVNETKYEYNCFFIDENNLSGVYIYQSYHNPNIAYRIYKEFAENNFNGYFDDILIEQLSERQKNVFLSKFPTGVVTLEGRIIGQEIPYFENSITLLEYSKMKNVNLNPINLYIKILDILKELLDNGIVYLDIHPKNFMIDMKSLNKEVKIIDFDSTYVKFEDNKRLIRQQLYNYRKMIDFLNNRFNIIDEIGYFDEVDNFQDCFEQLDDMSKKLVKKKIS